MRSSQLSDKGLVRPNNEDSVYSSIKRDLFIIADGMGGHKAGEIASKTAISKVRYFIRNRYDRYQKTQEGFLSLLSDAINYTNSYIFALAKKDENLTGMGTTIITVIIQGNMAYIGHIGDSRTYLIKDDTIKQITTDHSLAEELFRSGSITKEEALNYPHRNVITRALGCSEKLEVDTYAIKMDKGDLILLCTDGLSNMVSNEDIYKLAKASDNLNKLIKGLVDSANQAGGTDNISIIAVKND